MTAKEKVLSAIDGKLTERFPVMTPYVMLSNADHWTELTGEPAWRYFELKLQPPEKHKPYLKAFAEAMPFDVQQAIDGAGADASKHIKIIKKDGKYYYLDDRDSSVTPVPEDVHEAGSGGGEVETRTVFTKDDVKKKYPGITEDELIGNGINQYHDCLQSLFGNSHFTQSTCVINTFYSCSWSVGLTNLYMMLYDEPEFVHYLSEHILEHNIAHIRAYTKSGVDCIYVDDACASSDMLSRDMYKEFSWPYMKRQIDEINRLGKKSMVIYFGGIEDRADLIAELGADIVLMETAMKGYRNDYTQISKTLDGRSALAGNLDPYSDIQITSDDELRARIIKSIEAGRRYGKYIVSTGSPLTPRTPISRIRQYIDMAHTL